MFGAGAIMGLVAVVLPHGPGVNTTAWALNSSLGLPVCAGLLAIGSRCPAWLLHALLACAAPEVALGVVFGGGGPVALATSFFSGSHVNTSSIALTAGVVALVLRHAEA